MPKRLRAFIAGDVTTSVSRQTMRCLAWAAIAVFTWLAVRHVHDSVFLEDQTDQLQNFEALVRLEPDALLGPPMSGTQPTAHAFGPLGSIALGLPVALGFGIDGTHAVMSLLLSATTAVAFIVLRKIDEAFAWLWFGVFSATWLVWWNAGLFWASTLLLPAGVLLMAVGASCLWRPSVVKMATMTLIVVFAMQVHPAAAVVLPAVGLLAIVSARDILRSRSGQSVPRRSPQSATRLRPAALAMGTLTVAALGPYAVSEALTGGQNSRAMLAHVQQTHEQPLAIDTAEQTLLIAADPTHALASTGLSDRLVLMIGGGVALFAVVALARKTQSRALLWLTIAALVVIAGQAMFFALMRRPLAGFHYVSLPAPFYAIVPAGFLREAFARPLQRRGALILVASACVAFIVLAGPSIADRSMAPAMWSYRNIVTAIDALCDGGAADTAEGDGFAAVVNPRHDGVLRYLMKRRFADCRYQPGSAVLIAASRDGHYPDSSIANGTRYRRDTVRFPGIALYRRVRDDPAPVHSN